MPSWLRNQLARAFRERDMRSVVMLNRVYFKYRKQSMTSSEENSLTSGKQ